MEARLSDNQGGVISSVDPAGAACAVGLRVGDRVLSVNGIAVRDVVDWRFYADEVVLLEVERDGKRLIVELETDGLEPGLDFGSATFDGVRRCANRCPFCFLKGLPRGLRPSLYVKDDDYRYSFLYGNFVTLTNVRAEDWDRLAEQRLSPLYVSVHAADLALRRLLLGNPGAPDAIAQIRRLAELRIQVHTQTVLLPGVNDGIHLDRTISELAELHPTIQSIGVVPVGLTDYHPASSGHGDLPLRRFGPDEARAVVSQVRLWQGENRARLGLSLVHLADEFYLLAGQPFPAARHYDGFPQYENGIGMVRVLLGDWKKIKRQAVKGLHPDLSGRVAMVCGSLAAPVLQGLVAELNGLARADVELVPVVNRFFGETVTVSGLLTGSDLLAEFQNRPRPDVLVLPRSMLDATGERFLDDLTPGAVALALGVRVVLAESIGDLCNGQVAD